MINFDTIIKAAVKDIAQYAFSTNAEGDIPYLMYEQDLQAQLFRRLLDCGFIVAANQEIDGKHPDLILFEKDKCKYTKTKNGDPDVFDVYECLAIIELKLFWAYERKDSVLNKLRDDKEQLEKLSMKSLKRYVISFDYLGKLSHEDVVELKGSSDVSIFFVDVKNEKLHFL